MKKLFGLLVIGCLVSITPSAMAIPYSHTIIFTGNNVLTGQGAFTWSHPVPDDFEIPPYTVNSASLMITSRRAADSNDTVSVINFGDLGQLNAVGNSPVTTTFDLAPLGLFSTTWGLDQALKLSLAYETAAGNPQATSLTMVSSVFNLDYNNVSVTVDPIESRVPEPAAMLLLGFGLMGLAGLRRIFSN